MLAQMAATAGSVAVGSTIGHGLSHMLFGGSSSAPAASEAPAAPVQQQSYQPQGISCETQAKGEFSRHPYGVRPSADACLRLDFTKCLESADFNSCSWYLEQLKAVSMSCTFGISYHLTGPFLRSARRRLLGTKRLSNLRASFCTRLSSSNVAL